MPVLSTAARSRTMAAFYSYGASRCGATNRFAQRQTAAVGAAARFTTPMAVWRSLTAAFISTERMSRAARFTRRAAASSSWTVFFCSTVLARAGRAAARFPAAVRAQDCRAVRYASKIVSLCSILCRLAAEPSPATRAARWKCTAVRWGSTLPIKAGRCCSARQMPTLSPANMPSSATAILRSMLRSPMAGQSIRSFLP